ncbi:MAG: prepilin-type N-terminal cleavage/methylation domain-containing protein [Actinomycetota bacterium]|nr:prepilin-type N-terminal cleavage/methylation domain-containing protein [Actinomycetota bacterium]
MGQEPVRRDEGVTLVEVVLAMFLFALLSTGVAAAVDRAVATTRTSDARVTAASLAQRALESARYADPATLTPAGAQAPTPVVIDGRTYTVTRAVSTVDQTEPTTGTCAAGSVMVVAERITATVDWTGRPSGVPPVSSSTVRTVGAGAKVSSTNTTAGALGVLVTKWDGTSAGENIPVKLAPTGQTAWTDTAGCALFSGLAPRTDYAATVAGTNGFVDPRSQTQPVRSPITVTSGGSALEQVTYDVPVSISVTISAPTDYPAPTTTGTSAASTTALTTSPRAYPDCSFTGNVQPCVSGTTKTMTGLSYSPAGYEVWAGSCSGSRPASPQTATPSSPGGTATASATTARVRVRAFYKANNGTNTGWTQASETAAATNACNQTHTLGTTSTTSYLQVSLPAGTWTFSIPGKTPTASWPSATLVLPESSPVDIDIYFK